MPSKDRERDRPRRSEREKDRDGERTRDRDRDRRAPRYRSPPPSADADSTTTSTAADRDGTRLSDRLRHEIRFSQAASRTKTSSPATRELRERRRVVTGDLRQRISNPSMPSVESNSRPSSASFIESRPSLPYPTFSKAHSKELVGSRDNLHGVDILTPEPTDITTGNETNGKAGNDAINTTGAEAGSKRHSTTRSPPSPPLTNIDQQSTRRDSVTSGTKKSEEKKGSGKDQDEKEKKKKSRPKPTVKESTSSVRRKSDEGSKSSSKPSRPSTPGKKLFESLQLGQKPSSPSKSNRSSGKGESTKRSSYQKEKSESPRQSAIAEIEVSSSAIDSDATSIAPNQPVSYQRPASSEPRRGSPFTPTRKEYSSRRHNPHESNNAQPPASGLPPPPPPPPDMPVSIPKVDYLLYNGGLRYHVPKNFLGAGESANMPQHFFRPQDVGLKLFEPFTKLLEDYGQVMSKGGSLAVATGYRSVARRLLDRLEAVFARDISSEDCQCVMCYPTEATEDSEGVSWGEVLELVSGRQELPPWPPFNIAFEPGAVDVTNSDGREPMQKMDIDVPEEFRDHYVRQSRKTKQAVDKWLSHNNQQTGSPPEEVDDETLMFAMLTYLNKQQRETFSALLEIPMVAPEPKRETPKPRDRPESLVQSGAAIQRLYRLPTPPRDPETALYLLNNPSMHHVLATLAAISNDEWDILISGRFDGFLRSGADDDLLHSASAPPVQRTGYSTRPGSARPASQASHGRLRNVSAQHPSRASTASPASFGAPISVDEETEIAALAEIERNIYLGMEALEDAFEMVHVKAEAIRAELRERGAGLQVASLARRGSSAGGGGLEVLSGTPASGFGGYNGGGMAWDSSTDDGIDDGVSEIAPSDSASNISSSRRRRPKRRTERRTPVVLEEDEEDEERGYVEVAEGGEGDYRSRRKY
ncbi:hypothetical protein FQN52_000852 [Onygenales sp. PD_12]|nr:hypothetical protein FQN52_000852 [Onygenales sp. PD_12]KAK2807722.1 hypothetical protein FQN51_000160 [Onygenales sp. PD_10]